MAFDTQRKSIISMMLLLFSNDAKKNVRVDGWLLHYCSLSDDDDA